ncbi:EAL domain-containing protein [Hydrogenimonas urashimensis]|uniref:EAL domain-containing protein n=1 Tax=Hydrogenimonas urashimensis TaxID=2740515 RepID=UPI00191523EA|nr:EAL domain-containing protein [Hydrogenimonas urashimensis]
MKRLLFKVFVALFAAALGVGLMLYQQSRMKEGFEQIERVNTGLQRLHANLIDLQRTILEANYLVYYNNDLFYKKIETIRSQIEALLQTRNFNNVEHKRTYRSLLRLEKRFDRLAETINNFLTLNASLKNSSIYLPTLALKAYDLFDINDPEERRIILTLSRINASLFLAKNAMDESLVSELSQYKKKLEKMMESVDEGAKKGLLRVSILHLGLFVDLFPRFSKAFASIRDESLQEEIAKTMETFANESSSEIEKINRIGELLLVLYQITIGIVLYFVFHSEKETIRLKKTQERLQRSLITDHLTGLGNREAFVQDFGKMRHPALILVNIDRFKHINEFYGTAVGDHLLQVVAQILEEVVPRDLHARFYRLGGDDFGILFECEDGELLKSVIEKVLKRFEEDNFDIDSLTLDISVSIGASMAEKLFETADMALKTVKSSRRKRYAIYDPSLDVSETIARNIFALKQLKTAISQDAVIPFFQPIIDLKGERPPKYEALARLRIRHGETIAPYHFMEAAKQAKLSGLITTRILRQTLEVAKKTGAFCSVNLSAEDIASRYDRERIFALLSDHKEVASLITFEILETEEIEDYEIIAEFIRRAKHFGCSVSIDDFGSGYSNFEKLLQLDIDLIKIDGSLIKEVDHNTHAELVVRTIVDFAEGARLKTVAEFVHSKAVLEKVEKMGIDYAQGFYLGEPKPADFYFKEW